MGNLFFYLSLSVSIAAIIGIIRYAQISKTYYPFIWYLCLSVLTELLVYFTDSNNLQIYIYNIFALAEFVLFVWLFNEWGLFSRKKKLWLIIIAAGVILWSVLTFITQPFSEENILFRIFSSFTLIFFAVSTFNKLVVHEHASILKNPKFLISLGVILIYAFGILTNAIKFAMFGMDLSKAFRTNVFKIYAYTNFIVNLIYALAMLWAPKNKTFTKVF